MARGLELIRGIDLDLSEVWSPELPTAGLRGYPDVHLLLIVAPGLVGGPFLGWNQSILARQWDCMARSKRSVYNAAQSTGGAIKRCGDLLREIEKAHGANQNIGDGNGTKVLTRKEAATDAGLSKRQAVTAIRVSNIPDEQFQEAVESEDPPTVTALAERGKKSRPNGSGGSPPVKPAVQSEG